LQGAEQGAHLWGLLVAHQCCQPRQWQTFEIELLQQLASQVAIAIQQSELYEQVYRLNSDLEQQVQKRTAELQQAFEFEDSLKRITDKVRDSLDEQQILHTAVQELALALKVISCNASLYDLQTHSSTICYEYTALETLFLGRVVQMRNFSEGYDQLLQGQYFQFCSIVPNPVRGRVTMLACPIVEEQGVLGDLWLTKHPDVAFSEQDIRLVQQVANQCAIAIRQARLYQAVQLQVQELESLNNLKDDFLSTVSHELRTPMSNIKMAAQMLEVVLQQMGMLGADNKAARYFEILHQECQREINLINDLLDLSRLNTSTPLLVTSIDTPVWLHRLVVPFQERAQSQQQQLQLDIPESLPSIATDAESLSRIVTELLNNACKYTPAHHVIKVTARVVQQQLQLSISNSGVEIPTHEISRIFNKFYRIPNNDPWKHGGTGLGLALVKKLVERLSATIEVSSKNGHTQFRVDLPLPSEH
jgi:signal transduction histidine kinase